MAGMSQRSQRMVKRVKRARNVSRRRPSQNQRPAALQTVHEEEEKHDPASQKPPSNLDNPHGMVNQEMDGSWLISFGGPVFYQVPDMQTRIFDIYNGSEFSLIYTATPTIFYPSQNQYIA